MCSRRRINLCWIPNVFLLAVDLLASIQPTLSWSLFLPLPPSARRAGGRPHTHLQAEAIQEGQELWYMQAGHHQGGPHLQRWVSGMFDSAGSSTLNLSRREIRMSDLWPDSGRVNFLERMRERFIHEYVLLIPVQDGWRGWGLSQHAVFPVLYVNSLFSSFKFFQCILFFYCGDVVVVLTRLFPKNLLSIKHFLSAALFPLSVQPHWLPSEHCQL